jgi:hypothetical protein
MEHKIEEWKKQAKEETPFSKVGLSNKTQGQRNKTFKLNEPL